MTLRFSIRYPSHWGQSIQLLGSIPALGMGELARALSLEYTDTDIWSVSVEVPDDTSFIEYRYLLLSNGQVYEEPWQRKHQLQLHAYYTNYRVYDSWLDIPKNLPLYSSAFSKVLFRRNENTESTVQPHYKGKVTLKVFAPRVEPEQHLALTGNQVAWGNWNPEKAIKMRYMGYSEWEVDCHFSDLSFPVEYKFIIYNTNNDNVLWECGTNRNLALPYLKEKEAAVISGLQFRDEEIPWKGAGVAIPVFSLRSATSFGIGDFNDLKKLVHWVKRTGQKVIQILPVNDTTATHTWSDSYPYNAISTFALHPLYLHLSKLEQLSNTQLKNTLLAKQQELLALEHINYEEVDRLKWQYLRALYQQEGESTLQEMGFSVFFEQNKSWLVPYAAFSFLRDRYKTVQFERWEAFAQYNPQQIEELCSPKSVHYPAIALYYFVQYLAHEQLSEAKEYANQNGIILKGDIPIGISRNSLEAWVQPEFFTMDAGAGAPPDDFAEEGQNWGFPTYRWDRMEADNYSWWKNRLQHMSLYFDAYRIDHILGFFRIWEIPTTATQALCGHFNPALPFSAEEIKSSGFSFDEEKHCRPQIDGSQLSLFFGTYTQEACEQYLQAISQHSFTLKETVNTQQKIKAAFAGENNFKSNLIHQALLRLSTELLFIPDLHQPGYYHPRIKGNQTQAYKNLATEDKHAYDYLYWNFFYQRNDLLWKEQGHKRLTPVLASTEMLACGEDLGMIPHSVPETMRELQILSLEIERMPKDPNTEFAALEKLSYQSVCTSSTHDMWPLRAWWEEDPHKTQRYYTQILKQEGKAPASCTPELSRLILNRHLLSPALFTILPLQDWMSLSARFSQGSPQAERINQPDNPKHYWRYWMPFLLEDLLEEAEWNKQIREMIKQAGRI